MTKVSAGQLSAFPQDSGVCVESGDTRVAVFRKGDAAFAVADRCSHAEASLGEGDLFDNEVECPRHGAAFDITTGEALTLPATKPVATFATEIIEGEVFVSIPEEGPDA
ncbi:MAG: Rieske (2Fe-2S) protein [Acidimicrobiia bacterium]